MKRSFAVAVLAIVSASIAYTQEKSPCLSKAGCVPDQATALKIAEAIFVSAYGKEMVEAERPFRTTLKPGVWHVAGTIPCPRGQLCDGGVAEVDVSQANGRILRMFHGK